MWPLGTTGHHNRCHLPLHWRFDASDHRADAQYGSTTSRASTLCHDGFLVGFGIKLWLLFWSDLGSLKTFEFEDPSDLFRGFKGLT
jgi:hypothetical protein